MASAAALVGRIPHAVVIWLLASVLQQAVAMDKTIVILGASYAQSWGSPALPGYARVVNRGVGGDETAGMLARFPADVVALRPAAVLIWGHVNNITRSPPARLAEIKAATRGHYEEMLRQARTAGIEVILATEIPWTESGDFLDRLRGLIGRLRGKASYAVRVSREVRELNDFLRQLAAREHLRLLDFERGLARDDGTRRAEYAAADGSHISAAGYRALTDIATRELARRR
ncbi:MAG: hypothetical protein FJ191_03615 [Gammaproteobacteria bacterium]|nr:hypothetical protein [Gammaproteobacteria bacterium]